MRPEMNRLWFLAASGVFFLAVILGWYLQAHQAEPIVLYPSLTGEKELCLTCHADLDEISPAHPIDAFGCVICHGGERLALDADLAHSTMRGGSNPSDLAVVEESCGGTECHSGSVADHRDHIQRVQTSIQATYAGAIANIRYTFGAQSDLRASLGVQAVQDLDSATGINALGAFDPLLESHPILHTFSENCMVCHLHTDPLPGNAYDRFTGCAACHTPSRHLNDGQEEGDIHTLTTAISYTQCNTCHNRGNYDLRTMEFAERTDHPTSRLEDYYQPIAQFTRCEYTLDCIDCHTYTEAMGDGDIHPNMDSIVHIKCKTCHGTLEELPLTQTLTDPNDLAFRLAQLNPVVDLNLGDVILVTEQGEPLWNTRVLDNGAYELVGKSTKQRFLFYPVKESGCQQDPVQQESRYCHACHAMER